MDLRVHFSCKFCVFGKFTVYAVQWKHFSSDEKKHPCFKIRLYQLIPGRDGHQVHALELSGVGKK